jgi:hypothetical protein
LENRSRHSQRAALRASARPRQAAEDCEELRIARPRTRERRLLGGFFAPVALRAIVATGSVMVVVQIR